jgi:nitronate monooxygenase
VLRTALTERLGLRHPIVQAPMGGVAGPELADAVARAGALGMLTAGPRNSAADLRDVAAAVHERVAIGVLAWRLEAAPEILDAALEAQPLALAISAGDVAPYAPRVADAGIPLLVQVTSAEAARAAEAAGAAFVVAQGTDAGGHTGAVGTLPLLEAVLAAVELPVLAAGGIATGRGLAAVLAMGAAGAWIGTRFSASREALGDDERKRRIVAASETDTVYTRDFDIAHGVPWPEEYPGRALQDEPTAQPLYAGQAVGAISDVPSAGELVERLSREAEAQLRLVAQMLGNV